MYFEIIKLKLIGSSLDWITYAFPSSGINYLMWEIYQSSISFHRFVIATFLEQQQNDDEVNYEC